MDTRKLVDPALLPILDAMPSDELTDEMLLDLLRDPTAFSLSPPIFSEEALEKVAESTRPIPDADGASEITLTTFEPRDTSGVMACIYHVHGGGFVGGSISQLAPLMRWIAHELRCVVVSVDYRLAPEHPFPASIEDCYAGLAWTFRNAEALGIDPTRIGVKGESAGGGLAAALALLARDRGEYALAFQHLTYPMLDDRTCVALEPNAFAGQFIWTPMANSFGWAALLGEEPGGPNVSPYAAPARAGNLADLPPTYLACPSLDLFVDEAIDYAHRLIRSGVSVELQIFRGGFHGFDIFGGDVPIVTRARRDGVEALARLMAGERR